MNHDNQREIDVLRTIVDESRAEQLRNSELFFKADERITTVQPTARLEYATPLVGFKRLNEDAVIPTKAHATDSGYDLVASADVIVEPGETVVVPTGIAVVLPAGMEAQVRPRSGITSRTDIRVQYGTIDYGYTSGIGVIVDNVFQTLYERNGDIAMTDVVVSMEGLNDDVTFAKTHSFPSGTHYIPKGTRIAQLVIQRLPNVEAVEVFDVEDSERGAGGFGSTGVREQLIKESITDNYEALRRLSEDGVGSE